MVSLPTSRQTHAFVTNVHNTAVNNKDVKPSSGGYKEPSLLLPLLLSICLTDISAHTAGVQTHLMRCSCQVHGAATTVWVTDTPTPPLVEKSARYPSHSITVTLAAARARPSLSQQAALCGHKSQSDLPTSDGSEQSQTMLPLKHNQALAFLLPSFQSPGGQ